MYATGFAGHMDCPAVFPQARLTLGVQTLNFAFAPPIGAISQDFSA
jgi:hypothetical protein